MMQLNKPAKDLFRKVGVRQEIFQLSNTKDKEAENMGFTNVAKTVTAREDEEVWLGGWYGLLRILHGYRK